MGSLPAGSCGLYGQQRVRDVSLFAAVLQGKGAFCAACGTDMRIPGEIFKNRIDLSRIRWYDSVQRSVPAGEYGGRIFFQIFFSACCRITAAVIFRFSALIFRFAFFFLSSCPVIRLFGHFGSFCTSGLFFSDISESFLFSEAFQGLFHGFFCFAGEPFCPEGLK